MQIGLYGHTHGLGYRDEINLFARSMPATLLDPTSVAQDAERAGFHSMWFPDHVCMPMASESAHVANESRERAYEPRHEMLDAAVVMGAVATVTTRLRLGTSVLIAPYRNPLSDARQFATVDILSNGRLILGVGAGWMAEEYDALGIDFAERGRRTIESIEIYKRSWTDDVVAFEGEHFRFENLSMDPKPVQQPRPPILYGGVTATGARRAARHCDGFYPLFLDPYSEPNRYDALNDVIRDELDQVGRAHETFTMAAATTMHVTDASDALATASPRMICTGSAEQVLEDLEGFAKAGYSLAVCLMDVPSGELSELREQIDRVGREVLPQASDLVAAGDWQPAL
ncbi:LLM class F420-dependent oxidoreductase [Candidatus Poriferisodalis sp.]|uniref:LLM class F420-dependent oxidoreductase n=1 Tax=Candidatus Poriferisodalis sp. TaxID=3101277 RepID=UPI003B5C00E2